MVIVAPSYPDPKVVTSNEVTLPESLAILSPTVALFELLN